MITADLLSDCLSLAHAIAPELQQHPLYLIDSAELVGQRPEPPEGCLFGYTSDVFPDPSAERYLKAAGKWEGAGRSIVLCLKEIRSQLGESPRFIKQILIHELAHCVTTNVISDLHPTDAIAIDIAMSRFVSNPLAVTTEVDYGHGGEFVRRCLHLWQRAIWAGVHVEPWQLCGGFIYQMSDARAYLEALGDEPYRLRGEPFQLIDEAPAPAKFAALWAHDLKHLKEKIKC